MLNFREPMRTADDVTMNRGCSAYTLVYIPMYKGEDVVCQMPDYNFGSRGSTESEKPDQAIIDTLNQTEQRVFSPQDLIRLFRENREEWWILSTVNSKDFIDYLQQELDLGKDCSRGKTHTPEVRALPLGGSPPDRSCRQHAVESLSLPLKRYVRARPDGSTPARALRKLRTEREA